MTQTPASGPRAAGDGAADVSGADAHFVIGCSQAGRMA